MTGYLYSRLFYMYFKVELISTYISSILLELLFPMLFVEYFIYSATQTTKDLFSNGHTAVSVIFRTIVHTSIVGGIIGTCREACIRY